MGHGRRLLETELEALKLQRTKAIEVWKEIPRNLRSDTDKMKIVRQIEEDIKDVKACLRMIQEMNWNEEPKLSPRDLKRLQDKLNP